VLLRQLVRFDDRLQRLRDRVLRRTAEDRRNLRAPPLELDPCYRGIDGFVDRIVDLAAERIERNNCAPSVGR